jgi:TRAP-type transport system periplasmic protein
VRRSLSRRSLLLGAAVACAATVPGRHSRANPLRASQYHPLPATSHLQIYLTQIWDAVRHETGGQLDVTVYPNNRDVAFAEPQLLKMLQNGEFELFVLNGNILSQAHPIADIQGIPFAFKSSGQVNALNDGVLGDLMRAELANAGVYLLPFGGMENGFKHITAVEKPIRSAVDLEEFRMRTPGGALFVDFYETLGAKPKIVGLNKLYNALADREVDGQDNPLVLIEEQKLYEPCPYLSLSAHQWAGFNMIANYKFWRSLPENWRDTVIRNAKLFVPRQRAFVQGYAAELEQILRQRGMIVNAVDTATFRSKLSASKFYRRWRYSIGDKAWAMMEQEVGQVG